MPPVPACGCFSLQSLDEDCTLEEEDDGLIEDEDEIDQFNDDTFGAGAIGKECANTALVLVCQPGCVLPYRLNNYDKMFSLKLGRTQHGKMDH